MRIVSAAGGTDGKRANGAGGAEPACLAASTIRDEFRRQRQQSLSTNSWVVGACDPNVLLVQKANSAGPMPA